MEAILGTIAIVIAMAIGISLIIGIFRYVVILARRNNRDAAVWLLLSFIFNPLLIIIVLSVAGEKRNRDK